MEGLCTLGIGVMFAFFHCAGIKLFSKHFVKSVTKGSTISRFAFLRSFAVISSGPGELFLSFLIVRLMLVWLNMLGAR